MLPLENAIIPGEVIQVFISSEFPKKKLPHCFRCLGDQLLKSLLLRVMWTAEGLGAEYKETCLPPPIGET